MRQSILPRYIKKTTKMQDAFEGIYCRISVKKCRISVRRSEWRFLVVFAQSAALEIPMFCCYIDLAPGNNAIEK